MPVIGYGTYKITEEFHPKECVLQALEAGYRRIDTATLYRNEKQIGEALSECGIPREKLFITTKLWTNVRKEEDVAPAFDGMCSNLRTDYIDMLLIHWPVQDNPSVWRGMEKLYKQHCVRAIGVSNFKEHHIEEILSEGSITPALNQVELHPHFQQKDLRNYCAHHNITVEAWSPLMRGKALDLAELQELAARYKKSVSQIILRFDIQSGLTVIPKTIHSARMRENLDIFDFKISDEDMKKIEALDKNERAYRDPDNHGF